MRIHTPLPLPSLRCPLDARAHESAQTQPAHEAAHRTTAPAAAAADVAPAPGPGARARAADVPPAGEAEAEAEGERAAVEDTPASEEAASGDEVLEEEGE